MNIEIHGIEFTQDVSKAGKPYTIARVHSIADLAPARMATAISEGQMGVTYDTTPEVIQAIRHLPRPFMAQVEMRTVMLFGKPTQTLSSIVPLSFDPDLDPASTGDVKF